MIFLERVMSTRNITAVLPTFFSARVSFRSLCASGVESIRTVFGAIAAWHSRRRELKSFSSIWPAIIAPRRISDIRTGCREAKLVIASQRVRPEVAGPLTGPAEQSRRPDSGTGLPVAITPRNDGAKTMSAGHPIF
jgi:hypothetical protein